MKGMTVSKKSDSILIFFTSFLLLSITYRFWFISHILTTPNFMSTLKESLDLALGVGVDLAVGMLILMGFLTIKFFFRNRIHQNFINQLLITMTFVFILFIFALIYVVHKKLFTMFALGFNYNIYTNVLHGKFKPSVGIPYLQVTDSLFLCLPFLLYGICRLIPYRFLLNFMFYLLGGIVCFVSSVLILQLLISQLGNETENKYLNILFLNPISYLVEDSFKNLTNHYATRRDLPGKGQLHSIQLIDPLFNLQGQHAKLVSSHASPAKPMNVAIIVLESVGANYIFNHLDSNSIPMPFLKNLSQQGLWLENNYTSGNNSALGGFGILTGIYPNPTPEHFESVNDLYIPSIATWLGNKYHSLFVTSVDTAIFFPKGIISHTFNKFLGPEVINHSDSQMRGQLLQEQYGFECFLSQFNQLQEPFLSIYWSGAAHYPYFDYGSDYQITPPTRYASYARYMNNLRLLDIEIHRFYDILKKKNLLDNTLLIVIGDHGEGFGQHANSWVHGTTLNEEQIKVPVLFYQPKIFQPQKINLSTSSIDILPTILDSLGIKYDTHLLQGQSLLRNGLRRKYIFIYGDENGLATIDILHHKKMVIDFSKGFCNEFDLKSDPKELHNSNCSNEEQEKALIAYRNYQPDILRYYNRRSR